MAFGAGVSLGASSEYVSDGEMAHTVTASAAAGQADITVDDATGFDAGDGVTIVDANGSRVNTETGTVLSVAGNVITLDANLAATYPIGSSVRTRETFIPDDTFIIQGELPPGTVGGSSWGEFVTVGSPYGPRGTYYDQKPGIFAEVQEHTDEDPTVVPQARHWADATWPEARSVPQ